MSKYRDQLRTFRSQGFRPAGMVLAFSEPHPLNEVFLLEHFRVRLVRELTREEFMAKLAESRKAPHGVAVEAEYAGPKMYTDSAEDREGGPGPEFTHFYSAETV